MPFDESIPELQAAILKPHGCTSTFVETVPVHERFNGGTVWEGDVQVFDLIGHRRCIQRASVVVLEGQW
jgi:hypothetical protein